MFVVSIISLFLIGGEIAFLGQRDGRVHLVQATASPSGFTEAQCRGIADLSASNRPLFNAKQNGEWECTYLMEYAETGHNPSLFLQIRGIEPGVWSSFRLKLNFGSLLSRQVLGSRAAAIVYSLIGTNTPVKDLDVVLATGRELEISYDNITLRYRQERTDPNRFNLFGSQKSMAQNNPIVPQADEALTPQ